MRHRLTFVDEWLSVLEVDEGGHGGDGHFSHLSEGTHKVFFFLPTSGGRLEDRHSVRKSGMPVTIFAKMRTVADFRVYLKHFWQKSKLHLSETFRENVGNQMFFSSQVRKDDG